MKEIMNKAILDSFEVARMGGLQPISTEKVEYIKGGGDTYNFSVYYFNGQFITFDGYDFKIRK